jgi:hypothetical protein
MCAGVHCPYDHIDRREIDMKRSLALRLAFLLILVAAFQLHADYMPIEDWGDPDFCYSGWRLVGPLSTVRVSGPCLIYHDVYVCDVTGGMIVEDYTRCST